MKTNILQWEKADGSNYGTVDRFFTTDEKALIESVLPFLGASNKLEFKEVDDGKPEPVVSEPEPIQPIEPPAPKIDPVKRGELMDMVREFVHANAKQNGWTDGLFIEAAVGISAGLIAEVDRKSTVPAVVDKLPT